jgi:LuxR family quorum-sensing transcriptional regulator LasR
MTETGRKPARDEQAPRPQEQALKLQEQVNAFAETIDRVHSMSDIVEAIMAMISPLGYLATACGRFGHSNAGQALHFQNWHPEAATAYMRNGYMRIDPAPIWALQSGMAISVGELRGAIGKDHPGQAVWDFAAKFGYVGGYFVPQRAYDNSFGLINFLGARDPQSVIERIALRSLGYIAFERAEELAGYRRPELIALPPPALTDKEQICLRHLVDGKPILQIAKAMRVSEATVRFHSANLRRKIGVSSRAELVAFANKHSLVPRG